jgi:HNH endonuclease
MNQEKLDLLFWAKVNRGELEECWEWTAGKAGRMGYGKVKRHGKTTLAHRVSWEIANGQIPDGLQVCHHCDNPPCVNPSHLFLGTQKENLEDRDRKGRAVWSPGERNGTSKLTEDHVREVRRLGMIHSETTQGKIGERFGLTQSGVCRIVNGERSALHPDAVAEMCRLWAEHLATRQDDIARQFGVSPTLVGQILARKKWAHLT